MEVSCQRKTSGLSSALVSMSTWDVLLQAPRRTTSPPGDDSIRNPGMRLPHSAKAPLSQTSSSRTRGAGPPGSLSSAAIRGRGRMAEEAKVNPSAPPFNSASPS